MKNEDNLPKTELHISSQGIVDIAVTMLEDCLKSTGNARAFMQSVCSIMYGSIVAYMVANRATLASRGIEHELIKINQFTLGLFSDISPEFILENMEAFDSDNEKFKKLIGLLSKIEDVEHSDGQSEADILEVEDLCVKLFPDLKVILDENKLDNNEIGLD